MYTPGMGNLEPYLRAAVQNEMHGSERVVWTGQPVFRFLSCSVLGVMIFGIPWTGFSLFWMWGASGFGSAFNGPEPFKWFSLAFSLFGLPFVLIGFGMLSAPLWVRWANRRTVYVITTERALTIMPHWFGRKVRSFEPDKVASMERVERADGSGDLIFEQYTQRRGSSTHTVRNGFLSVAHVRDVEELLRRNLLQDKVRAI